MIVECADCHVALNSGHHYSDLHLAMSLAAEHDAKHHSIKDAA